MGQIYELNCPVAGGNPLPYLQWLYEGRPIEEFTEDETFKFINYTITGKFGELLTLIGVDDTQQHHFSCVLTNKVGAASKEFFIQVIFFCYMVLNLQSLLMFFL